MDVPIAQLGHRSTIANHLRVHGWRWSEQLLLDVTDQLVAEDIRDSDAMRGVLVADIDGAVEWPQDVQEFITRLCKVRTLLHSPECI